MPTPKNKNKTSNILKIQDPFHLTIQCNVMCIPSKKIVTNLAKNIN